MASSQMLKKKPQPRDAVAELARRIEQMQDIRQQLTAEIRAAKRILKSLRSHK